jgi:hypothetical protein
VYRDPALAQKIEGWAQHIAGAGADAIILAAARLVAEAQLDLQRLRACRHHYIEQALADPKFVGAKVEKIKLTVSMRWLDLVWNDRSTATFPDWAFQYIDPTPPEGPEKLATILSDLTRNLAVLDRYERRALSRRKFAIRDFDAACGAEREHPKPATRAPVAAKILN